MNIQDRATGKNILYPSRNRKANGQKNHPTIMGLLPGILWSYVVETKDLPKISDCDKNEDVNLFF